MLSSHTSKYRACDQVKPIQISKKLNMQYSPPRVSQRNQPCNGSLLKTSSAATHVTGVSRSTLTSLIAPGDSRGRQRVRPINLDSGGLGASRRLLGGESRFPDVNGDIISTPFLLEMNTEPGYLLYIAVLKEKTQKYYQLHC